MQFAPCQSHPELFFVPPRGKPSTHPGVPQTYEEHKFCQEVLLESFRCFRYSGWFYFFSRYHACFMQFEMVLLQGCSGKRMFLAGKLLWAQGISWFLMISSRHKVLLVHAHSNGCDIGDMRQTLQSISESLKVHVKLAFLLKLLVYIWQRCLCTLFFCAE